ncbi:MAG TPA: hypothetical protein VE999_12400 [Gemmataceae bacterium]|nr:hypothetical protein [Gemmataceae bacterium]
MLTRWFAFWKSSGSQAQRPTQERTFRPNLENLEERDVPSVSPLNTMVPIQVTSVTNGPISQGQIPVTVNGLVGANPFQTTGTLTATPSGPSAEILDLHLNPIQLNLLGLGVQTSSICLDITAQQGGGLLGNLLYNLGNALNSGTGSLGGLNNLLDQFLLPTVETTLLNTALNSSATTGPTSNTGLPPGANDILHLSVGPVNLNLLGLNVDLNNCATPAGPVTVDVYTETGPGDLLGNLLNDVSNLLNSTGTLGGTTGQQLLGDLTGTVLNAV